MNESTAKNEGAVITSTDGEKPLKEKSSTLTTLPNELFDLLLIYLSPCDIVHSLSGINQRLNSIIYRFINIINVSSKKKQWLNKHLPSIRILVTKIKFNHSQLRTLFPTATTIHNQYPYLQSIIWNYQFDCNDRLCVSYLNEFKTKLSSLTLHLNSGDNETVDNNVALVLLQNDSLIEKLAFTDVSEYSIMWFSFKPNTLKLNSHLKHLMIKLHYVDDLFILIQSLPKLEYLNVEVCEVKKDDTYEYTAIQNQSEPLLKQLIIDALDFTYPRMLLFLKQFQESIEFLSLNMSIYEKVDGEVLESTIISKMPKLKEFKFLFNINVGEDVNINAGLDKLITTFRSTAYWLTHPVMCFHDRSHPCFTIASLPWILKESDSITSAIMNYRTNTTTPLQLNDIKSIYLAATKITLEFLNFIKKTFVHLNKMTISWHTCTLRREVFRPKTRIHLNTIKTLKYYGATDDLEYIDFLLLTPNIQRLIVDGSTVHVINGYVHENERVAWICEQIQDLNIFRNYSDCDEDETEETFPNARVISKNV